MSLAAGWKIQFDSRQGRNVSARHAVYIDPSSYPVDNDGSLPAIQKLRHQLENLFTAANSGFFGPPAREDRLKLFALNGTD